MVSLNALLRQGIKIIMIDYFLNFDRVVVVRSPSDFGEHVTITKRVDVRCHTRAASSVRGAWSLQVKCVVETRDQEHTNELERMLRACYSNVYFGGSVQQT